MEILDQIDHLVYATPNVGSTVSELERILGVRATPGGNHLGRGTRNELCALGEACYLEIVGPDHSQDPPQNPRWFGIDQLTCPRLVGWAARTNDLEKTIADGIQGGVSLGPVISGSRMRNDGVLLSWKCTDPSTFVENCIIPFFIDWLSSPHPAGSAAQGLVLTQFSAEHPDPPSVRRFLRALSIELDVTYAEQPALIATVKTPTAEVILR